MSPASAAAMNGPAGMKGPDQAALDRIAAEIIRGLERRLETPPSPQVVGVRSINFMINGGGSAITAGVKGFLGVDFACTITGVELLADTSGSLTLDIGRAPYATFPAFNSLVASAPPKLFFAQKYSDASLTGWTTTLSPDDVLRYQVTGSPSGCTLVLVKLRVRMG